ncbi:MAG: autoinducer binding domain-containing protein [Pseudomonadota bacterium]
MGNQGSADILSTCEQSLVVLRRADTSYEVFRVLKTIGTTISLPFFSIISLPGKDDEQLSPSSMLSNCPPEMVLEYDERGLLKNSPVIAYLRNRTSPLPWELDNVNLERPDDEREGVAELFSRFGITGGVYFPTYDAQKRRGAVSFSGPVGRKPEFSSSETALLAMVAQRSFVRATAHLNAQPESKPLLSSRELECLRWTASGKTSHEIGLILGISEHTVDNHLTSVCKKLNADNRAHAVWRAVQKGLLE